MITLQRIIRVDGVEHIESEQRLGELWLLRQIFTKPSYDAAIWELLSDDSVLSVDVTKDRGGGIVHHRYVKEV